MRILHTSDWHIGKRLMDRERLPEQVAALEWLAALCKEKEVDLILVAGDVFDTFLPSAEAEEAFFRAVKALAGEERAVVIISGNHDDGVRLSASAPLAGEDGIYLFGGTPQRLPLGSNRPVRAVEGDESYLVIENAGGERVYINALPYPNEARLKEDKTDESYSQKIVRRIARGDAAYRGDMPYILLSHIFVAGGSTSESERDIDLGGARAVPVSCLPQEGYVALGHLHKRQKLGENIHYSGSLLQYSFDENADKSVYLLEAKGKSIEIKEQIPITAGKKLIRLEARSTAEALTLLPRYPDAFIELTLHLTQPLTAQETSALRAANEGLVSLAARVQTGEIARVASRAKLGAEELFVQYCISKFGQEPSDELKTAFLTLLAEGA